MCLRVMCEAAPSGVAPRHPHDEQGSPHMRRWQVYVVAGVLTACSGGGVTDSAGPTPRDSTPTAPPGGTVQRASLTVRVQFDSADRALVEAAGLSVAGLTVRLTRAGDVGAPRLATTDADGVVRFEQLLEGQYTASAERALTPDELLRVPEAARERARFAGGGTRILAPPAPAAVDVTLAAARRGGLVLSEWYLYLERPTPYNWGQYIEIYNNGDTTAYLDGMVVALSNWLVLHTASYAACDAASYLAFRHDAERLWVSDGIRFPGSGRDFPVAPGQAVVYASDALNHRTAANSDAQEDLSRAHFEHVGGNADIDNPLAINVVPVFATRGGAGDRGMRVETPGVLMLISSRGYDTRDSTDLPPLNGTPSGGVPRTAQRVWGVRRDEIVDAAAVDYHADFKAYLATTTLRYTLCLPFVHPAFDRTPAELFDYRKPLAVRRRSLGLDQNGREILMRTGTSARDLELTGRRLSRSLNK
jgi:hypothetical protein